MHLFDFVQQLNFVSELKDGTELWFGKGKFDDYCIYVSPPNHRTWFPLDREYFEVLDALAEEYGAGQLYSDFIRIYNSTDTNIDDLVLEEIQRIADKYPEERDAVELMFSILYAAMIAEENKEHTILGKRIKRLGIHQVLFEKVPPADAAEFSKGKSWRRLDAMCKERGF